MEFTSFKITDKVSYLKDTVKKDFFKDRQTGGQTDII